MALQAPTRRLVSQDDASLIERAAVPRSRFTGSWTRKTAFDAGYLVPMLVEEVLPGDHMSYNVTAYLRMATPLFPLFDNQRIDTFFFFVPNRLLWEHWPKFMGEQLSPGASIDYTLPQVQSPSGGFAVGSVADHFGLPTAGQVTPGYELYVNALPFRAYNLIFNTWFRDQNLYNPHAVNTAGGPDLASAFPLAQRAKSHDYFTSALPWPQRHTSPTIPLGGLAPLVGIGFPDLATYSTGPTTVEETGGSTSYQYFQHLGGANPGRLAVEAQGAAGAPAAYADLSEATGVALETFRAAFLVQSLLERDARGGARYTELIRAHFGVINPDFRLSRPEYIGGGQSPLQVTPIAQTAPTEGAPVGVLGAAGTSVGQHRASYAATEHGWILGLINVRTELSYQQGIPRAFSRQTRLDYFWPALGALGEQAILRKELYATGDATLDDQVFGYQERYHEYRTRYSEVTGLMRSTAAGTLDNWHLAQRFLTAPTLNETFILDTPPMSRVLAAGSLAAGQQYLADILFQRTAVRPVPMFGTPAALGRF